MAASQSNTTAYTTHRHTKLPRLPPSHRISKRPLLRSTLPLTSPGTSTPHHTAARPQPKTIYISSRTPFAAAAKRITKYLANMEAQRGREKMTNGGRRDWGGSGKGNSRGASGRALRRSGAGRRERGGNGEGEGEGEGERKDVVLVKGTGRAIGRVMALGLHFRKRDGYCVLVRTGSVGAVDDVVRVEGEGEVVDESEEGEGSTGEDGNGDTEMKEKEGVDVEENNTIPEARIRFTSLLEVEISLET